MKRSEQSGFDKRRIHQQRLNVLLVFRERATGLETSEAQFVARVGGISTRRLCLILLNCETMEEVVMDTVKGSGGCFGCLLPFSAKRRRSPSISVDILNHKRCGWHLQIRGVSLFSLFTYRDAHVLHHVI